MAVLAICVAGSTFAQGVNEVTLVVSGDGATKDAATTVALRSAIEQAFGVFVSANTTILNDELVKDEIATVSSGNIQSYKELGCVQLDNGNTSVSLQATVSISKLVAYAQSKGSECEFAGAMFGQQLKLIELNKQNAAKSLENMYAQLCAIVPYMFDYELEVNNPQANGDVEFRVIARANSTTNTFGEIVQNTLEALNVQNAESVKQMGVKLSRVILNLLSVIDDPTYALEKTQGQMMSSYVVDMKTFCDTIDSYMRATLYGLQIQDNLGNVYENLEPIGDWQKDISFYDSNGSGLTNQWLQVVHAPKVLRPIMPINVEEGKFVCTYIRKFNIPLEQLTKISNFTIKKKASL